MRTYLLLLPVLAGLILPGCSSGRKIGALRSGQVSASLSLPREQSALPEVDTAELQRDTMTVTDLNGREVTIMNAVKDEKGEMVATDVLKAATVTARFRNVAERHGKVELCFQVIVPEAMQDSRWQLRFYPMMFLLGDSTALANVVITGKDYRQEQLRGYQHYERFLKSIIDDPDHFIRHHQLEVFIRRNIPQLYRFRRDSSFVSEEEFRSSYGVSGEQAIRHYTRMMSLRWNNRKISRKDLVFKKRVKVPIQTEGLRLDTVIQQPNGDFIYDYVQEVAVRPKLKKVDITLEGEIYEQADPVFRIPRSKPLTFYHYMIDLTGGPCIYKRVSGCGSGTEYMAVTPWGDLYPCHQFVGDEKYRLGDIWNGVDNKEVQDEFKLCNAYARPDCKDCWARLYCSGGCAANAYHATGSISGIYEYGCELFKKRMECAIMMKVAQAEETE